jgi:hypothetical protein
MRPAAVNKVVGVALLLIAVASLSPVVSASVCEDQCMAQWLVDKGNCQNALAARLDQLSVQLADCLNHAATPVQAALCTNAYNTAAFAAQNTYRACVNQANTVAWNCYRACSISPTHP